MTTKIVVGEVEVRLDGELSVRQVRALLREAAGIAVALAQSTGQAEEKEAEEPRPVVALGFTSEIATFDEPDLSEWFEEAP
jgi:hypothetical protein